MAAVDGQHALRRGLLRCTARDSQRDLSAARTSLFVDGFALDPKDLPDAGEVKVAIERRTAPNAPRLDAAMIGRRNLEEISVAARLEQQGDCALQPRLVALDREMIVRLPRHHITGYCSSGQQSVAACYGQGACFFGA